MAAMTDKQREVISARLIFILVLLCVLGAGAFSAYLAIFLMIALIPSFVCFLIERNSAKYLFKSILGFNIFGLLPYVELILESSHHCQNEILLLAARSDTWMHIYCSAMLGIISYIVIPFLYVIISRFRVSTKIQQLKVEISSIDEAWEGDS